MKRFQNILASVDVRQEAQPALAWATVVAERNQAKLKLVDVLPEFSWPVRLSLPNHEHVREMLLQEKRTQLEALAAPLREKGLTVTTAALSGKTSLEIVREVLRDKHDLVVRVAKGAHSSQNLFFGNTTWRLFRKCPCPVWAVRPDSEPRFQRILAAVDPVPHDVEHAQLNRTVIELARSLAEQQGGQFDVLHVWSMMGESLLLAQMTDDEFRQAEAKTREQVARVFDDFLAEYGLTANDPHVHLLKGQPDRAIPEFVQAAGIDLLVLGTVGRTGVMGFLMGNTAEAILSRIQCAVLAVKPEGFLSPVPRPA